MKFKNAEIEINNLQGLDVVLMVSMGDAYLDDGTGTRWKDDDFGL